MVENASNQRLSTDVEVAQFNEETGGGEYTVDGRTVSAEESLNETNTTTPATTRRGRNLDADMGLGGFSDPSGEYPRPEHQGQSSLNREVTGQTTTEINVGGGDPAAAPPSNAGGTGSEYGRIQVQETPAGHRIVLDDTNGSERFILQHASGAGISMTPDGSITVRSRNNLSIGIDADGAIIIDGEFRLSSKNLTLDVTGDLDVNVTGNYNLKVAGDISETAYGNKRTNTGGNRGEIVKGTKSSTVLGAVTETFLGAHNHAVKGNLSTSVQGNATVNSSGPLKLSSMAELIGSSPRMNLAAADMSVIGASGTIGGENIIMYNYNMYTGHTVHAAEAVETDTVHSSRTNATAMYATTFHGDLDGNAKYTWPSATPKGNNDNVSATETAVNNNASAMPSARLLSYYLQNGSRGVAQVMIDEGDHIRNTVDRTAQMGNVSNRALTPEEARAMLLEESNAQNAEFMAALQRDGSLSENYNNNVPPGLGRSNRMDGSTSTAPYGGTTGPYGGGRFISGSREYRGFSPDSTYDPQTIDPRGGVNAITSRTLVGNGIPISTFLGMHGSAPNLTHLGTFEERQALARQLLLQAEVIKLCRNDEDQFKDFRIIVTSGVIIPNSGERLTEGSVRYLQQNGRAIVYTLYNARNENEVSATYEFAEHLANNLFGFDKIIVTYDNFDPRRESRQLTSQIVVVMPEVDNTYTITSGSGEAPTFLVESRYNGRVIADDQLVEVDAQGNIVEADLSITDAQVAEIVSYGGASCRNARCAPIFEEVCAAAARASGITRVVIGSAKQPGVSGCRTGSTRHDTGLAGDVVLTHRSLGQLSVGSEGGRQKIEEFVINFMAACEQRGFRGCCGAANHSYPSSRWYMGGSVFHMDMLGGATPGFGSVGNRWRYWGGSGGTSDVPAPAWLVRAAS